MGQLLSSPAVWLAKFPVKRCEFTSSLWAGVVLLRGASEGVGCCLTVPEAGSCRAGGLCFHLASRALRGGWAAALGSSGAEPSRGWSSSSDSWPIDECKSLFSTS